MTNWDDYRFFLAIARSASIRKAARILGVSHSTVLRRISAFEESLEVRLFERTPTGYFTTEAGDEMLQFAQHIEEETTNASRFIAGRDKLLNGKVHVSMPGILATLLMPDLEAFRRTHPGIELQISLGYSITSLAKREADVAIRISNDPPENLFGRRVLKVFRAAYVCKDYLPGVQPTNDLTPLSWIGLTDAQPSFQWMEESDFPDIPIGAVINDPQATLEAVKAGMGMAMLPCYIADTTPDIYRMPPATLLPHRDLWILTHADMRKTARIRKFISFMAEAILLHRDLLEGKQPQTLPDIGSQFEINGKKHSL